MPYQWVKGQKIFVPYPKKKKPKPWVPRRDKLLAAGRERKHPPKNAEMADFGEDVKRARMRLLKTQTQFGEMFGISQDTVSKIESGRWEGKQTARIRMLHEKLRVWVETNKPLRERKDSPFDDIENLLKGQQNGRKDVSRPTLRSRNQRNHPAANLEDA